MQRIRKHVCSGVKPFLNTPFVNACCVIKFVVWVWDFVAAGWRSLEVAKVIPVLVIALDFDSRHGPSAHGYPRRSLAEFGWSALQGANTRMPEFSDRVPEYLNR